MNFHDSDFALRLVNRQDNSSPDTNPPYALDVGSIPSFRQTTKEGPLDPLCCLVETVGIEPTSKNISGRTSPSAAGYLILPAGRHTADSMQTIPLGPLTLTGDRVRGFLHK